jgi:hypothetical protein
MNFCNLWTPSVWIQLRTFPFSGNGARLRTQIWNVGFLEIGLYWFNWVICSVPTRSTNFRAWDSSVDIATRLWAGQPTNRFPTGQNLLLLFSVLNNPASCGTKGSVLGVKKNRAVALTIRSSLATILRMCYAYCVLLYTGPALPFINWLYVFFFAITAGESRDSNRPWAYPDA